MEQLDIYNRIAICDQKHHTAVVPLVGTMAFAGSEYWCAKCDAKYGTFGVTTIPSSPELERELKELMAQSQNYRRAIALNTASQVKIDDKWISPKDIDLPTRARLEAERKAYVFSEPRP